MREGRIAYPRIAPLHLYPASQLGSMARTIDGTILGTIEASFVASGFLVELLAAASDPDDAASIQQMLVRTAKERSHEQMECEYEATKAVPDTGLGSAMQIGFQRGQLLRQCMQLRGYR